jgi:hypothetical protein
MVTGGNMANKKVKQPELNQPQAFRKLRVYNLVMGSFHLAQSILILFLSNSFSLPVTTNFIGGGPGGITFKPPEVLFDLPVGPMVAIFLLLSATAHFLLSLPGIFEWYKTNLSKGINYARWYEYALSSSIMIVLIAMLSGIYDVATLIAIFGANAAMNLFGLMMELHNQTTSKTNWLSYTFGCFAGFIPWVAISIYFFGAISQASENIPTFVYFILPTLFVFFFSFALNMWLQYKKSGKWRDYLFGERVYVFLSLTAKTALAWQVFGGALAGGS